MSGGTNAHQYGVYGGRESAQKHNCTLHTTLYQLGTKTYYLRNVSAFAERLLAEVCDPSLRRLHERHSKRKKSKTMTFHTSNVNNKTFYRLLPPSLTLGWATLKTALYFKVWLILFNYYLLMCLTLLFILQPTVTTTHCINDFT